MFFYFFLGRKSVYRYKLDNSDIRKYLRTILKDDYIVLEAADGKEGLDTARRKARVAHGRQLLATTDRSIAEVAYSVGFASFRTCLPVISSARLPVSFTL